MAKTMLADYRCGIGIPQLPGDEFGEFGKDPFLIDGRRYLQRVRRELLKQGKHLLVTGKVFVNRAGVAVSGEVYLTFNVNGARAGTLEITRFEFQIDEKHRPDGLLMQLFVMNTARYIYDFPDPGWVAQSIIGQLDRIHGVAK